MSKRTDEMSRMYQEVTNFLSPWTIGFDKIFDDAMALIHNTTGYPPYNIVRETDLRTIIEIALAGFSKDDVRIYEEKNVLHIVHDNKPDTDQPEFGTYSHRGIAARSFHLAFPIAHGVMVSNAHMKDGLLSVLLVKVPPQEPQKNFVAIQSE